MKLCKKTRQVKPALARWKASIGIIAIVRLISFMPDAQAQLRVEIAGVDANQLPVAVAAFANEATGTQKISAIIQSDLARTGVFKLFATNEVMAETASIDYNAWRAKGADALVTGSVQKIADGRVEVRYKLWDTVKSAQLSALAMAAQPGLVRTIAHKIADDIYQKLTGIPGVFATRIAYVAKSGGEYRLEIADADGEGKQIALRSREPIISPAWSPDGLKVAYVSFEAKKPVVYVQNLATKKRSLIANYKGSNSAPAWSPDGSQLALALARDGLTQIYIVNADGSHLRQITKSDSIDTEPQFSADGQMIYFVSDRSGGPQIYRIAAQGGSAQRITFGGNYNISPRIAPDGKTLAYISRRDGQFQMTALDLGSAQELRLSSTSHDEAPSFSPNGKYIMYASNEGGRRLLSVVSIDGRTRYNLTNALGDIREPRWGPFLK